MADETSALVPVEEGGERGVYVPLRPIAEYLGLAWPGQYMRLKRDPVLSEALKGVIITITPSVGRRGGGPQEMICLPLKFLPGWLCGVNATRVKPELREKVIRYQRECFDVLWRAFQSEALTRREPSSNLAILAQVRETALAVAQLAEQQMQMERRLDTVEARLDRAAEVVAGLQRRAQPAAAIGDEQAAAISGQVKALAEMLTAQDPSTAQAGQRQNHYQGIFAELYRRFGVSSYKLIRTDHYQAVLQFLEDWRRATGE